MKKRSFLTLVAVMALTFPLVINKIDSGAKTKLDSSTLTIYKGKTQTLTLKNSKKKAKWSIVSGKSYICLKNKKKTSVEIVGVKKGTAKVQALAGTKKYFCKVIVKTEGKNSDDIKSLKALIKKVEKGSKISQNTNNQKQYDWDENGRLTGINWSNCNISGAVSFSGLTALKNISVANNKITSVDVSQNSKLTKLLVQRNSLKKISVSSCPNLRVLSCFNNNLTEIALSSVNTKLEDLFCGGNQLKKLVVKNCPALTELNCSANSITSLDLSKNTKLEVLACGGPMTNLDISANKKLSRITISNSSITQLDFHNMTELKSLSLTANDKLTSLNISGCSKLEDLDLDKNNSLKTLDASNFPVLRLLTCRNGVLQSLNIKNSQNLESIDCSYNQLTQLELGTLNNLISLDCQSNQLTSLDLSQAPNITGLTCTSNQLTALDVSKNPELCSIMCADNPITSLDFSNNPLIINGGTMYDVPWDVEIIW
jgi:YD repeat-containing protein